MNNEYFPIDLLPLKEFVIECSTEEEHIFFRKLAIYSFRSNNYNKANRKLESTEFTAILLFILLNKEAFNSENYGYKISIPTRNLLFILLNIDFVLDDFNQKLPDSIFAKIMTLL